MAEPGEARLPSAPPVEAAQNTPPKTAEYRRDQRERQARPQRLNLVAVRRGHALLNAVFALHL